MRSSRPSVSNFLQEKKRIKNQAEPDRAQSHGRQCLAQRLLSRNLTHPQGSINNYKFISKAKPFDTHTEEQEVLIQYIYTHTRSIVLDTHGEQC